MKVKQTNITIGNSFIHTDDISEGCITKYCNPVIITVIDVDNENKKALCISNFGVQHEVSFSSLAKDYSKLKDIR